MISVRAIGFQSVLYRNGGWWRWRWGMLERFRCRLEPSGRCFLRRRQHNQILHSGVIQGAANFDLTSDASMSYMPVAVGKNPSESIHASRDTLHLYFLYPLKTLAFLRKLSRCPIYYPDPLSSTTSNIGNFHCGRFYGTKAAGEDKADSMNVKGKVEGKAKKPTRHWEDNVSNVKEELENIKKAPKLPKNNGEDTKPKTQDRKKRGEISPKDNVPDGRTKSSTSEKDKSTRKDNAETILGGFPKENEKVLPQKDSVPNVEAAPNHSQMKGETSLKYQKGHVKPMPQPESNLVEAKVVAENKVSVSPKHENTRTNARLVISRNESKLVPKNNVTNAKSASVDLNKENQWLVNSNSKKTNAMSRSKDQILRKDRVIMATGDTQKKEEWDSLKNIDTKNMAILNSSKDVQALQKPKLTEDETAPLDIQQGAILPKANGVRKKTAARKTFQKSGITGVKTAAAGSRETKQPFLESTGNGAKAEIGQSLRKSRVLVSLDSQEGRTPAKSSSLKGKTALHNEGEVLRASRIINAEVASGSKEAGQTLLEDTGAGTEVYKSQPLLKSRPMNHQRRSLNRKEDRTCVESSGIKAKTPTRKGIEASRMRRTHRMSANFQGSSNNLNDFLKISKAGHWQLAWDLYEKAADVSSATKNRLMAYLQTSTYIEEKTKILILMSTMDMQDLTLEGIDAVVDAYLYMGSVEEASQFLRSAWDSKRPTIHRGATRFLIYCIQHGLWKRASELLRFLISFLNAAVVELVTDRIPSAIPDFRLKFVDWIENTPEFDIKLAVWLARGFLRFSSQQNTPQLAADAAEILKPLYSKNLAAKIPLEEHLHAIAQLHKFQNSEAAIDLYFLFRNMTFEETPSQKTLSVVLYDTMRAFCRLKDIRNVEMVFDDWFRFGHGPNEEACLYIMRWFSKQGELSVVKDLFKYYHSHFPMNVKVLTILMQVHTARGELSEVEASFNKILSYSLEPSLVTYNILLNAYKRADDINGAFRLFDKMLGFSGALAPDVVSFQTIMSLCANRGDSEAAEHFYELARQRGIGPDLSMDNALVYSYVRRRDSEGTRKAMDLINRVLVAKQEVQVEESGETDFRITRMWNSVLTGYLWTGELDLMSATYHHMRTESIAFDEYTYAILMHGLCVTGKVVEAEKMLEMLEKEESVKPVATHYATLMLEYMFRKDVAKVWEVYNRMQKVNISPTFVTQALLIQVIASLEHSQYKARGGTLFLVEAETILAQTTSELDIVDLESPDCVKSGFPAFLFVPLLQIYAREGSYQRAMDLFDQFLALSERQKPGGSTPSLRMYLAVMNGLFRARDTKLMLEIWKHAKEEALRRLALSKFPEGTLKEVLSTRTDVLASLFSVLIRALSIDGDMKTLYTERDTYLKLGFQLDNVNLNDIVQANSLNGRLFEAFRICEKALIKGWSDPRMRRRGVRYERPKFYPFVRTMEGLLSLVKAIQSAVYFPNDPSARLLHKVEKRFPNTWAALDALDNVEHRIARDALYKAARDEWGYPHAVKRDSATNEDVMFGEEQLPEDVDDLKLAPGVDSGELKLGPSICGDIGTDLNHSEELLKKSQEQNETQPPVAMITQPVPSGEQNEQASRGCEEGKTSLSQEPDGIVAEQDTNSSPEEGSSPPLMDNEQFPSIGNALDGDESQAFSSAKTKTASPQDRKESHGLVSKEQSEATSAKFLPESGHPLSSSSNDVHRSESEDPSKENREEIRAIPFEAISKQNSTKSASKHGAQPPSPSKTKAKANITTRKREAGNDTPPQYTPTLSSNLTPEDMVQLLDKHPDGIPDKSSKDISEQKPGSASPNGKASAGPKG